MAENFPQLFDFKIRPCDEEGARTLIELIKAGLLENKGAELRKDEAKKYMEKTNIAISGVKVEKRINPQIK
jgi:hypothetical protein